jgi:amidohydrolase
MLLGAARKLVTGRSELRGTIRLIFQPAEESIMSGSLEVIAAGVLENVAAIYALHCDPSKIVGQVGFRDGAITSANDRIGVKIYGTGGHSARPHLTVNPINLIGLVVTQLPARVYEKLGSDTKALVGFGSLHSGDANNAIPSSADAAGTVRISDTEVWADLPRIVEETLGEILDGFDARWELEYNRVCPTVVNDPIVNSYFREAATKLFGSDNVIDTHQSFGGEDFAWYLQTVPGALARLGVRPVDAEFQADLHSGLFDVDEGVLDIGASLLDEVGRLAVSSYAKS